jgi:hypothetical protein
VEGRVSFYAGIDSRRASRHHQHLIETALAAAPVARRPTLSRRRPTKRGRGS